ncbi:MAG: 4'-phosphopantetheinyl transferase superfamily protein [Bacteroidales bacterium]|jgi:phosphopantetheinyl transferase|nr:4'-phosphopantetheinyl transferase superfamily protein [Bacteroidales bacterium]
MPLIYSANTALCVRFALWKIEETENALFQGIRLSVQDQEAILSLRLEKRRLERIACRRALGFLLNTNDLNITYGFSGEPLCDVGHISFSHSGNYAAAAVSQTGPVGIDIEKITPKILELHHKFVSDKEREHIDLQDPKAITRIWCAKEAIYKMFPEKSLNFIEDIEIFPTHQATLRHSVGSNTIHLFTHEIEELMIVVANFCVGNSIRTI